MIEAPVFILSMYAPDLSEASSGFGILYSKKRLNLVIYQAQAITIISSNTALVHTNANSITQIEQIKFFCELVECSNLAKEILNETRNYLSY